MASRAPRILILLDTLILGGSAYGLRNRVQPPLTPGRLAAIQPDQTWVGQSDSSHSQEHAKATFEIRNTGGQPLRIFEVTSGCGCATPVLSTNLLPPGDTATVQVDVIPFPVGEKTVSFGVRTDSPVTPELPLTLRVVGGRNPPFLMQVFGDLIFNEDPKLDDVRRVTAITVEPVAKTKPPIVSCDLPFLEIGPPTITEEPYTRPGTVARTYVYTVRFARLPDVGLFQSFVSVVDPWDAGNTFSIAAHGEATPAIKLVPPRLTLRPEVAGADPFPQTFLVVTKRPEPSLIVEAADNSLRLIKIQSSGDGRLTTYSVRPTPDRNPVQDESNILVRTDLGSRPIKLPVRIIKEGKP